MKIQLLISLVLVFTAYVGAMTSENDSCSCQINQDSVRVSADTTQLPDPDPLQGYIFDRDTTKGWIVNHCDVPPAKMRFRPLTFTPIDGKKVYRQPQWLIHIYRDTCGRVDSCGRLISKSWNYIISD